MTLPRCIICDTPATPTVVRVLIKRGILDHNRLCCPGCQEKILNEVRTGHAFDGPAISKWLDSTGHRIVASPEQN